jgi:acyl-coenzyme A thioesterase PaaI-like protein
MFDRLRTRLWRLAFRFFPAYRGTGGRVTHIEPDWSEVRVEVPANWRTRNYVGTIFGGSMYGAVDPIYRRFEASASRSSENLRFSGSR